MNCASLGEYLIANIEQNKEKMYSLFIPVVEKLSDGAKGGGGGGDEGGSGSDEYMHLIVKFMPMYC